MLPGLTSRCTSPCEWAASRAAATWVMMWQAREAGSGPVVSTSAWTFGPCTNRMAMNSTPLASPASKIGMMLGWSTAAAVRDSRMNRCRKASSSASSGVRTLIATGRSSRVS